MERAGGEGGRGTLMYLSLCGVANWVVLHGVKPAFLVEFLFLSYPRPPGSKRGHRQLTTTRGAEGNAEVLEKNIRVKFGFWT